MHTEVNLNMEITNVLDTAIMKYSMRPLENRMVLRVKLEKLQTLVDSGRFDYIPELSDVLWYLDYHLKNVDAVLDAPSSAAVNTQASLAGLLQEHVDL